MGRVVIYNGKGEDTVLLEKGKRYEVESETLDLKCNVVTLKGIPGKFEACLFDDCGEGVHLNTKVMKPSYIAKVTVYSNDINSYLGVRLKIRFLEGEKIKTKMTTPVQKIEQIYGNIYKFETSNSVYITEVTKRTVG